ncbi:hypothetical protein BDZ94DRAFT_1309819 [Collybia nuda]|uniref:Uncharacterized protein n=1 Tax=Collybia nuda TaxID=64659 RepID=A0A9P6CIY5_9AGAR|nr:hypothetical protein BDZ94DRAFT_1309819 [Collybia nuda]
MFIILPLALLPVIAYASPTPYADPIHIPLARRAPAAHDAAYYASVAQHLRGKYGYGSPSGTKRDSADFEMINQQSDASYLGTVNIGTP